MMMMNKQTVAQQKEGPDSGSLCCCPKVSENLLDNGW
jgi:hypothetical protein